MPLLVYFWLFLVFVIGLTVGSFLNVAIARLPSEKSLLWPGSRCGSCWQRIRWYDNLPLVSYLWLRGRCRTCGAAFSARYFLVELVTGLGFAGLFYLVVVCNIRHLPAGDRGWGLSYGFFPKSWWVAYGHHVLLFCFLLVASVCDLQSREIPLRLTLTGTLVGLVLATLLPWPWPYTPLEASPRAVHYLTEGKEWIFPETGLKGGVYAWPFWGPLPAFFAPGGNWQTGLATGLAGVLAGTFLLRVVGKLFSIGLGKEALGLGDADLMMMGGAFLGWQPMVVAFFLSIVPALFFGLFQMVIRKDNSLPFGPSLAAALLITCLTWLWLGPLVQPFFFWGTLLLLISVVGLAFILGSSFVLGMLRR